MARVGLEVPKKFVDMDCDEQKAEIKRVLERNRQILADSRKVGTVIKPDMT